MDVITFYLDDTAPKIVRSLSTQGGGDFDVEPGVLFRLRVRPLWSSTIVLDVAMSSFPEIDEVTYSPAAGDFDTEGIYRAWIYVDYGTGLVQSTDEFQINVLAHAPGQGTEIGSVWRACRALEPVSWDSLRAYPDYGDPELQRAIELAKLRVLQEAVPVANEESLDARVVDYVAKKVLVDNILSAAISFWTNQVVAQTARGNSEEVATYPDRIKAAESAIARYRNDLKAQQVEVDEILGSTGTLYDAPVINDTGATLTPGLDEYPAMPVSGPYWNSTVRRYW